MSREFHNGSATATRPSLIGSEATNILGENDLRSRFNLGDGAQVKVTVFEQESNWQPPTPDEVIADWCEAARNVEDEYGVEKR